MLGTPLLKLKDLSKYKVLIIQIAIKDVAVKYRYPFLGGLWAFLMPFFLIVILVIVFSKILKVTIPGYPFPVYLITGILPWNYFASSLSSATVGISNSKGLIKNVYFPREIIPIAIVLSNIIKHTLTPKDILIAISSSGQSKNIIAAVETAKNNNSTVKTLSGFKPDNKLRTTGDINFWSNSNDYGIVEMAHQFILHNIADRLIIKS